ncbi:glutathione S-transferase family protein [Oligoflexaceae bacterium]|nr:glutathione S-transferase family protein [Oligoflexaceae bacterium]
MLKLYYNPQSRAVMTECLLKELKVPYELVQLEYGDGSMRTPEFLKLNPMGKIPVIEDGDTVVTETAAIFIYLADKYKIPKDLAPSITDKNRGEYLQWMVFSASCIDPAMAQANLKFEGKRETLGWGNPELVFETVSKRLEQATPYLFGDTVTAADLFLGMSMNWAIQFGIAPKTDSVLKYIDKLKDLDCWNPNP